MTFFDRLNICLERYGMNCKDLSVKLNIHNSSITGWKQGSFPRADIACEVANIFQVSVEWLITGEENFSQNDYLKLCSSEKKLIDNYRKCNNQLKNAIFNLSENLKNTEN